MHLWFAWLERGPLLVNIHRAHWCTAHETRSDRSDPPLTNSGHSGAFRRFACTFDLRAYISWPGFRCPGRDGPPTFVSPRRVPHIQLHSVSNILDQSRWTDVNKVHRIHRKSLPIQQGCQHPLQVLHSSFMWLAPGQDDVSLALLLAAKTTPIVPHLKEAIVIFTCYTYVLLRRHLHVLKLSFSRWYVVRCLWMVR